jgi:hypothetical protein
MQLQSRLSRSLSDLRQSSRTIVLDKINSKLSPSCDSCDSCPAARLPVFADAQFYSKFIAANFITNKKMQICLCLICLPRFEHL